jgi:hypothetical protein
MNEEEFVAIDQFVNQKCLVQPVISAQNLCSIYQCPDQQMYRARIQYVFALNEFAFEEPTREALIDMMHGAILFASDNALAFPKAIVFLSIYMELFKMTIESPYYQPTVIYRRYEKLLLGHALDRPPHAAPIFELADIKLINEFVVQTFFRNIKLIINCFTQRPVMAFRGQFPVRVTAPEMPPLIEMDMVTADHPDEEGAVLDSAKKSPRSPKSPRAAQQAIAAERAPPKPKEAAPVPPPPAPEPEGPEDRGPEVPVEMLRGTLATMHDKFVADFEEKERQLMGKIKELEIRMLEKPQLKKPMAKKK